MPPGNEGVIFTVFADEKRIRPDADRIGVVLYDSKGGFNPQTAATNMSALPAGTRISVGMVNRCSYGMNDYDIEGGLWSSGADWLLETYSFFMPTVPADKILLMDYTNAQIAAHGMATGTVAWATNNFTRHSNRTLVNVLFGDGTVRPMEPASIDPGASGNYARYWEPQKP
jgi:prepilin-type processing-associated H-X9-DG protein